MTERNFIRPLVLSALLVLSFLLVYWILLLIFYNPATPVFPFKNLLVGLLTGLGLGIGFEMANIVNSQKIKISKNI